MILFIQKKISLSLSLSLSRVCVCVSGLYPLNIVQMNYYDIYIIFMPNIYVYSNIFNQKKISLKFKGLSKLAPRTRMKISNRGHSERLPPFA